MKTQDIIDSFDFSKEKITMNKLDNLAQVADYLFNCAGALSVAAEKIAESTEFNGGQKVEMVLYLSKVVKTLQSQAMDAEKRHDHVIHRY